MITQLCTGYHMQVHLVVMLWCLLSTRGAFAWQEEYIAESSHDNVSQRYTWDSNRQPRYEDILAERIKSQESILPGEQLFLTDDLPESASAGQSWYSPLLKNITVGPVAGWRQDGGLVAIYTSNESFTSVGVGDSFRGPVVNMLGWRVGSVQGALHPWAQVNYNRPMDGNVHEPQAGSYGNGVDVSLGADVPLSKHVAAWASMSQSDGVDNTGEAFMYNLGVSARF